MLPLPCLDRSDACLLAQVPEPASVVTYDQPACRIGDEHPLRNVQASVRRGVNGGNDAVAGHLHATRLTHYQDNALVCSRVEAAIWCNFDVSQALFVLFFSGPPGKVQQKTTEKNVLRSKRNKSWSQKKKKGLNQEK